MNFPQKNNLLLPAAILALIISYHAIFGHYFPNDNGRLGHDYSYFLPILLDGHFWHHTNGFWKIPWFTPSFCGGWPNYVNVQGIFYTLPQVFTFLTDPLTAVSLTFILFAGLGMLGFYLLLRRAFFISKSGALLGAGLFLFNGFYAHRILIGHFGDYSFMLLPFISLVLLRPLPDRKQSRLWRFLFDSVIGGLLIAYMVQSGFGPYLLPVIIAIILVALIHGILYGRQWDFWLRWTGAGFTSFLLCASKLSAIYYLMRNFPRSDYKLPGAKSFLSAAWLSFKSLFFSPAFDPDRMEMLTNAQWFLGRHEWEYSVTIVPLLIILYGGLSILRQTMTKGVDLKLNWQQWLQIGSIVTVLILPVAVNTYNPNWNAFLKQLPLIKSSSNLIRWFIIYIPFVILAAVLILEKIAISSKCRSGVAIIGLSMVVAMNAVADRDFYLHQPYDPQEIIESFFKVKTGLWTPKIEHIGVYLDKNGRIKRPVYRNNMLIHGASQLYCYEALFGYHLKALPFKTLRPGPVFEEKEGVLNIKNPACYVWPEANGCQPGDHFTVKQKKAAEAFVNYRPFPFQIPFIQKVANRINAIALIAALAFLAFSSARALYHYVKNENFLR